MQDFIDSMPTPVANWFTGLSTDHREALKESAAHYFD